MDLTFAKLFARIAKIDPVMKKVKAPKAKIGDGFYNAEFRAGRWLHWLEDEGFLKLSPAKAGEHILKLGLYDEGRGVPHKIEIVQNDQVIGTYTIPSSGGWLDLNLKIDLPKGETRLLFRGALPKRLFPIRFPAAVTSCRHQLPSPAAVTSLSYSTCFALSIPEINRLD